MKKKALAVACHPDDIEFMMGGTLARLAEAGVELHYMNVANGSCGSAVMDAEETVAVRAVEAQNAAKLLRATFHPSLVDDLQVYYRPELVAKLCAVVREIQPEILLLPSPQDYMEDHTNVSRLMVTAAFCRGMRNFPADPVSDPVQFDMAVYHALPYGLHDSLRKLIIPDFYLDVSSVMETKTQALACHESQKHWLDESQGQDSYLITMQEMTAEVGKMSKKFEYAEGWRQHLHLGFGPEEFDPLSDVLGEWIVE
ncbi:MAG: PIG-L family deacetylase [Holophagae bacterium]|nr:PIG-L family deacetylase [Holophagae bacterium]